MTLQIHSKLGPYEILGTLGSGGMGEVYRARDTRLDRTVAIKVLPAAMASNPDVRERFEREARAVAALNHPHICVLYDVGRQDGVDFLVMEYLEGETLEARLAKGVLPLDQTLNYAVEIADALDKAHRKGLTHRDLKPANIMLTRSGAKLLDFGLAKLQLPQGLSTNSAMPTNAALTVEGTILGTLQYMAPEQLEGSEVDARTDVFAFGAVLYEMLTGSRAFEGQSQMSLASAILKDSPKEPSSVKPVTPVSLDHIVMTCLNKDPDDRWQSAGDLMRELKWIRGKAPDFGAPLATAALKRSHERLGWLVGWLGIIAALGTILFFSVFSSRERPLWVSIPPPVNSFGLLPAPALSPDGQEIAFTAPNAEGSRVCWVRSLDSQAAHALPGTGDAVYPFWSPDGKSIAFFKDDKLEKIDIAGGSPQVLADAPTPYGGTWSRDGVIVYVPASAALYQVSASGSDAKPLTTLGSDELGHWFPFFLPDGKHFLYTIWSADENIEGVYVRALGSAEGRGKRLVGGRSKAEYANGFLLFARGNELFAKHFDLGSLELSGDDVRITDQVGSDVNTATFSSSQSDVLAFSNGNIQALTQLTWMERSGKRLRTVGEPGNYSGISLAPDDKHVAVEEFDSKSHATDIWIIDADTGVASRLTSDKKVSELPLWSKDSSRVLFTQYSDRWFIRGIQDGKVEEIPLGSSADSWPEDWSSDAKYVSFRRNSPQTADNIFILPLFGERKLSTYLQTKFSESRSKFSPDVHWIAYGSNESGKYEVYVDSFPQPGNKVHISTNGGFYPQWGKDGKDLYYESYDGKLQDATVQASGSHFEVLATHPLFTAPHFFSGNGNGYQVNRTGNFLFNAEIPDPTLHTITVGIHWTAGLKK